MGISISLKVPWQLYYLCPFGNSGRCGPHGSLLWGRVAPDFGDWGHRADPRPHPRKGTAPQLITPNQPPSVFHSCRDTSENGLFLWGSLEFRCVQSKENIRKETWGTRTLKYQFRFLGSVRKRNVPISPAVPRGKGCELRAVCFPTGTRSLMVQNLTANVI